MSDSSKNISKHLKGLNSVSHSEIIIVGGGGHSKVVMDVIASMNKYSVIGIVDPSLALMSKVCGVEVLGGDDYLNNIQPNKCGLSIGVGMMKASALREQIFHKLLQKDFQFPNTIHSTAIVSKWSELGVGVQVMAGAIINPAARIFDNVIINTGAIVEHDCTINSGSHVAPGAVLGGGVCVGKRCCVGLGARILPNIIIGDDVTIGAGAVVTRNTKNGETLYGVPAKEVKGN